MSSNINWRRWQGWLVGLTIFLLGIALIVSDRIAARATDRSWIVLPQNVQQLQQWPDIAESSPSATRPITEIIFPKIHFHYTPTGSYFGEIIEWIERNSETQIDINWDALSLVGLTRKSTLIFEGTDVRLPDLLDALAEKASAQTSPKTKLGWEIRPDRLLVFSTATDLRIERECRAQRSKAASPVLHQALDRRIPYVKLRKLTIAETLDYCQRISGVKIRLRDQAPALLAHSDVIAQDITFEDLISFALHRTDGASPGLWHFKVEGEGLIVFRDGGGQ
jgi:hypothetical protein